MSYLNAYNTAQPEEVILLCGDCARAERRRDPELARIDGFDMGDIWPLECDHCECTEHEQREDGPGEDATVIDNPHLYDRSHPDCPWAY
jgi:hypothetical protein